MTDIESTLRPALPDDASRAAAERFRLRAADEGLVDVAYALVDSPLGLLLVAGTSRGLVEIGFRADEQLDFLLGRLAKGISPRVLEAPERLNRIRRELDEYFEGRRRDFDVPLDWRLAKGFTRRVLLATARVPYGRVSSYREVAAKAGSERAVRAAGNALGANPIPIVVPCHRILRTGGALGGYGGGPERKRWLLELEGVL